MLAAIGVDRVSVWRRPVVGILSTGDEIIEPGEPMRPGQIYDSNARVLADAVRELGAEPRLLGIVSDDMGQLRERVGAALADCDVLLLSGGTSKGTGDLSYRVVSELPDPGIVAHGVALKPGKPICLAATGGKPVVILPGFPTSAIFTFHEFVAPVIRELGGQPRQTRATVKARLAVKVNSEIGRTEYLLVGLAHRDGAAGTGRTTAVRTGSRRTGGLSPRQRIRIGHDVQPRRWLHHHRSARRDPGGRHAGRRPVIEPRSPTGRFRGHGQPLHRPGLPPGQAPRPRGGTKFLAIGSTAGLDAVRRGECDLAGSHLLDPDTGEYNRPFLGPELALIPGYGRQQGLLFRRGDVRFGSRDITQSLRQILADPDA